MDGWMIGVAASGGLTIVIGAVIASFRIGGWVRGVNSDRSDFKDFTKEIRADIKEILLRLSTTPTATAASPIQLTEFGQQISRELDVKAWAGAQAHALLGRSRRLLEHEIYDLCIDHVQSRIDDDATFRDALRANAYQHGIDAAQVQRVYVIELRDEILRRLDPAD